MKVGSGFIFNNILTNIYYFYAILKVMAYTERTNEGDQYECVCNL